MTEQVVSPPPGHPRFPLFDALRAIAILLVVVGHTGYFAGAEHNPWYGPLLAQSNLGVVIFFVISGFLLYRPMCAERFGGPKSPRVRDYGRRRALRILPAYWLALSLLVIYPGLEVGTFSHTWWAFYGLVQIYPIWDGPARCFNAFQDCGIAPGWSLASEAAFYVSLPFLMFGTGRLTKGLSRAAALRTELGVLAVLAAGSVALQIYSLNSTHSWLSLSLATTFVWFAGGMSLALISAARGGRRGTSLIARPEVAWAAAIGLYVLLAYVLLPAYPDIGTRFDQGLERVGLGVVAMLLVLPAVFEDQIRGRVHSLLSNPVMKWIGVISFGIFLYHFSVALQLAQKGWVGWIPGGPFFELTVATLGVTVPIAALSYYLLERPILRFK